MACHRAAPTGLTPACILLAFLGGCGRPAEPPTGPHFSIMTYNVNFGMPQAEEAIEAIRRADTDIVCLQETTPAWEQLLRARLAHCYGHMEFRHWRGAGGQAILSKMPFQQAGYLRPSAGWFPGWIVEIDSPVGPLQILNVHLHPPLDEAGQFSVGAYLNTRQIRRSEIEELSARLEPSLPTIVLGDFNERDGGAALTWLHRRGFADALGKFDRYSSTWQWRTSLITLRSRFDHILHSKQLRCLHARVLPQGGSDHFPVVGVFEGASD